MPSPRRAGPWRKTSRRTRSPAWVRRGWGPSVSRPAALERGLNPRPQPRHLPHSRPLGGGRARRLRRELRRLLHREQRPAADGLARGRGVLDWHEVRVRSETPLCRELQHLWSERGEDARRVDRLAGIWRLVHRIEIRAHMCDRFLPRDARASFHRRRVTHTEAEQESAWVCVTQRALSVRHRHWIAREDVRDARRDDETLGRAQEQRRVGEDLLAAERLRDPQHGDAETFEFARIPARVVGAETFDIEAPRAGATELLRP